MNRDDINKAIAFFKHCCSENKVTYGFEDILIKDEQSKFHQLAIQVLQSELNRIDNSSLSLEELQEMMGNHKPTKGKSMEDITFKYNGQYCTDLVKMLPYILDGERVGSVAVGAAIDKLHNYENTDLSPEEVEFMQFDHIGAEYFLDKWLDKSAKQKLRSLTEKSAYIRDLLLTKLEELENPKD